MSAPAASQPESLRIIWSASLVQGLGAGFAFLVRPGRIMGAKKFTQEHYVADVHSLQDPAARTKAMKLAADLEKGKRFEFTRDQIVGIEMAEPGRFGPGRIVFRTASGEETVKLAGSFGTGSGSLFAMLRETFETFVPGKVRKVP